jgi:hypothetical protein
MTRRREVKLLVQKVSLARHRLDEAVPKWLLCIHWVEWVNTTTRSREKNHRLTIMDQTHVEVQAAHNTNNEANKVKKGGNGRHGSEETPLDESPSECPRIEHETPPNEVQSRQSKEH